MTFPKTCPHCDAGPGPYVNSYLCGTYLRAGHDAKKHQTKRCVTRQLHAFADKARQLERRLAALEAEAKQAREDEAWANERTVLVEFQPVTSGWYASAPDGVVGISATAPTIHGALRALRANVEGGAR